MRWYHLRKLALLICLAFFSCPLWAASGISVKDMAGRTVTLDAPPNRIACLSPGTLRLLVYLQAQEKLVGVEDIEKRFPGARPYTIANPQFSKLPSIGPGGPNSINKEPDYEKLLSAQPDIIYISYMEKALANRVQQKTGIPVFVVSYGPFGTFTDTVYESILAIGKTLGKEKRAKAVVGFFEEKQQDLLNRVASVPEKDKPWVYIGGIGFKGSHGIESTETIYPPFEWVRAKNIAKRDGSRGHLFVDKERLLSLNPDIIFIDGGGNQLVLNDLKKNPAFYAGLKSFQNKQVYTLHSFNWYMTNLGTVVTDAYAVGKLLYPGRFSDIELAGFADEVYSFLLGKPVYKDLVRNNGPLGQALSVPE